MATVIDPETASPADLLADELDAALDRFGELWRRTLTLTAAVRAQEGRGICLRCSTDLDHALRAVEEFADETRPC